jgi:hypothetical protein
MSIKDTKLTTKDTRGMDRGEDVLCAPEGVFAIIPIVLVKRSQGLPNVATILRHGSMNFESTLIMSSI